MPLPLSYIYWTSKSTTVGGTWRGDYTNLSEWMIFQMSLSQVAAMRTVVRGHDSEWALESRDCYLIFIWKYVFSYWQLWVLVIFDYISWYKIYLFVNFLNRKTRYKSVATQIPHDGLEPIPHIGIIWDLYVHMLSYTDNCDGFWILFTSFSDIKSFRIDS